MNHINKYKIEYIFLIAISAFITLNVINVKKKSDAFEARMEKQKIERLKFSEEIKRTSEIIDDINTSTLTILCSLISKLHSSASLYTHQTRPS